MFGATLRSQRALAAGLVGALAVWLAELILEFVLLLPRTGLEAAQALVTRLSRELAEQTYTWGGMPHALPRVSFGIAAFPEDGQLADQLIAKADEQMYADKARARGRLR